MSVAPIRTLKRNGGGALIKYYDGTTLLGQETVAINEDVLHPSITMPTKSGYTFVGWSTTTSKTNYVTELLSTGEPMNLYAMYAPNTLVVIEGGLVSTTPTYTVLDTFYVSGSVYIQQGRTPGSQGWGQWDASATFTLNRRFYQSGSVTVRESNTYYGWETDSPNATGYYDGDAIGKNTSKTYSIGNGNHTLRNAGRTSEEESRPSTQVGSTYVTNLTLSNPQAWT